MNMRKTMRSYFIYIYIYIYIYIHTQILISKYKTRKVFNFKIKGDKMNEKKSRSFTVIRYTCVSMFYMSTFQ